LATLQAVQAGAINKGSVAPLSWGALNQELAKNQAPGLDYKTFVKRWNDPNDPLKASGLIKKFDGNQLIIDTRRVKVGK
jgi:hypothetical protein